MMILLVLLYAGLHLSSCSNDTLESVCKTKDGTNAVVLFGELRDECPSIEEGVIKCCVAHRQCNEDGTLTKCGYTQWNCIDELLTDMGDPIVCRSLTNSISAHELSFGNAGKGDYLLIKNMGINKQLYKMCSNAPPKIDKCARDFKKCKDDEKKHTEMPVEADSCGLTGKWCFDGVRDVDRSTGCARKVGYVIAMMQKKWSEVAEESEPSSNPFDSISNYTEEKWGWSWGATLAVIIGICFLLVFLLFAVCYCCANWGLKRQKEARRQLRKEKREEKRARQEKKSSRKSRKESSRPRSSSTRSHRFTEETMQEE